MPFTVSVRCSRCSPVHRSLFTVHALLSPRSPPTTPPRSILPRSTPSTSPSDTSRNSCRSTSASPCCPMLGVEGPRPPLTRIVFTRDSIEWGHAATVSDLLTQVPGVYLWRGGYIGRPEPVSFQGRGARIGRVLPGRRALRGRRSGQRRRWIPRSSPSACWSGSRSSAGPASCGCISSPSGTTVSPPARASRMARGDDDFARYEASLERRYRLGARFRAGGRLPQLADRQRPAAATTPTPRSGLRAATSPRSSSGCSTGCCARARIGDPYVANVEGEQDTIGLGYEAKRTDALIRMTLKGRSKEGLGARADLMYHAPRGIAEGIDQQINQIGGYLTYRAPTFSVGRVSLFTGTRWTLLDARASLGWNPVAPFTRSGRSWCISGTSAVATATTPTSLPVSNWCGGSHSPAQRGSARWWRHRPFSDEPRAGRSGLSGGARLEPWPGLGFEVAYARSVRLRPAGLRRVSPDRHTRPGPPDRVDHGVGRGWLRSSG